MAGSSSTSGPYPWEAPTEYQWDAESEAGIRDSSSEDSDLEQEITPGIAAGNLLAFLEDCHSSGQMSAKSICTLAFWGAKAGLSCLEKLAVDPSSGSGNFQRHLTKVWGLDDSKCYVLQVPAAIPHELTRGLHAFRTLPPREQLHGDIRSTEDLSSTIEASTLPGNYSTHPIVLEGLAGSCNLSGHMKRFFFLRISRTFGRGCLEVTHQNVHENQKLQNTDQKGSLDSFLLQQIATLYEEASMHCSRMGSEDPIFLVGSPQISISNIWERIKLIN